MVGAMNTGSVNRHNPRRRRAPLIVRTLIVLCLALPATAAVADLSKAQAAEAERNLLHHARQLRNVARSMKAHARTRPPAGLNAAQKTGLAAKRRDLEETADAALKLAAQLERRARKARLRTLTRADMDSLGVAANPLTTRISRQQLQRSMRDLERSQETVRNQRQMASTAFQNFDQKANQLYNLLSSVMKAMNEMRMGTTRNML